MGKKMLEKRQAKDTFNLMVQQLRLEDIFGEYRREHYSVHCKTSPQYCLILRNNSGP